MIMQNSLFSESGEKMKAELKTGVVDEVEGRLASVKFSGESKSSLKKYKCMASYTPEAGDYVILAYISGTYIILGKVG